MAKIKRNKVPTSDYLNKRLEYISVPLKRMLLSKYKGQTPTNLQVSDSVSGKLIHRADGTKDYIQVKVKILSAKISFFSEDDDLATMFDLFEKEHGSFFWKPCFLHLEFGEGENQVELTSDIYMFKETAEALLVQFMTEVPVDETKAPEELKKLILKYRPLYDNSMELFNLDDKKYDQIFMNAIGFFLMTLRDKMGIEYYNYTN